MKRALLALAVVSVSGFGLAEAVGCSSSSSAAPVTMTTTDSGTGGGSVDSGGGVVAEAGCVAPYDAAAVANSACGHPGDKGNSIGVGSFCVTSTDCNCNSGANLCTTLGGSMAAGEFFCTMLCTSADGGEDSGCGENASCQCQGGPCGCVPNSCVTAGDGG